MPWKLTCPSCQAVFPSNDFASFYESGKDENGLFRRELADERFLRNELYPEKGEGWGVDDGLGWKDEAGDERRGGDGNARNDRADQRYEARVGGGWHGAC